jgi:hypothetical protein
MWNRVNIIYLLVCICILSLPSMHSPGQPSWKLFVILLAALTYPFSLVWIRPKTGIWLGSIWLLVILTVALFCDFVAGLLWYVDYEYVRLGTEFKLPEALGWYLGESPAFFLVLVVIPAAAIAGTCYLIGYGASFLFFRLVRNQPEPEKPTLTTSTPE